MLNKARSIFSFLCGRDKNTKTFISSYFHFPRNMFSWKHRHCPTETVLFKNMSYRYDVDTWKSSIWTAGWNEIWSVWSSNSFFFNATNVATRKTRTGCEPWPLQSVLYLLSYQTKWELFVVWVDYKPADNESRSTDMILIHESRVFETTCLLSTNITSSSQLVLTGEITFRIPFRHEFLRPSSLLRK